MPCMGPDYSGVPALAESMTNVIMEALARNDYKRPEHGHIFGNRLGAAWDENEKKLREVMAGFLKLKADENF